MITPSTELLDSRIASQSKNNQNHKDCLELKAVFVNKCMKIKEIINHIIFYVSVPKCVCCDERLDYEDRALCKACLQKYSEIKNRNCSQCARQLYECTCPNEYLNAHYVKRLVKVYRYLPEPDFPTNRIIYSLKHDDRKDVMDFAKDELSESIKNSIENPSEYIFTNVPRRRRSIAKYGTDHSAELAKALAREFGAEYRSVLISKSKKPQKEMTGDERLKNVRFKYKRGVASLHGKRVILIDDVVTTGASLGSAATLIKGLGAKEIVGGAMAIAYKDPFIHFKLGDRFS